MNRVPAILIGQDRLVAYVNPCPHDRVASHDVSDLTGEACLVSLYRSGQ